MNAFLQIYQSASPDETEAIARTFSRSLRPGDVIAFQGGMGVGKTAFVRGLAQGLGCTGEISSPTFALVHEYGGCPPLYHFDMYRVNTLEDLYSTGFFDYLDLPGILAVEWSENIVAVLEENTIFVRLEILPGEDASRRKITIEGGGRF